MTNSGNFFEENDAQISAMSKTDNAKRGKTVFILSAVAFCLTIIVSAAAWLFMKDFLFNTDLTDAQRLALTIFFALGFQIYLYSIGGAGLTFILSLISAIVNKKRKVFSIFFILTVCVYAGFTAYFFVTL